MLKIFLLWPGKTKEPWLKSGQEYYLKKIKNYYMIKIIETRAATAKHNKKGEQIKEEAKYILSALNKLKGEVIALDVNGRQTDSVEFSNFIRKKHESCVPSLIFLIGGAYGLAPEILSMASYRLSLSKMTFTHEMSRVILLEQLFRAATIIQGIPYHH